MLKPVYYSYIFSDQFAGSVGDRFQTFDKEAGDTWNQFHYRSHLDTQS